MNKVKLKIVVERGNQFVARNEFDGLLYKFHKAFFAHAVKRNEEYEFEMKKEDLDLFLFI